MMEMRVVAKEFIKPSSPTPRHLRFYELCLLDQMIPPVYSPIILFFRANPRASHFKTLFSLKTSLSESLSRFYPFAGRVKDFHTIECNDDGACFVDAKINSTLSDFLGHREPAKMNKLLPREFDRYMSGPGSNVLIVQVTNFSCGGFSVGFLIAHMIVDGTAISCFLRDWAATSRKEKDEIAFPIFNAASIFPRVVPFPSESSLMFFWGRFFKKAKASSTRFVFDAASINALKLYARISSSESPTRVEVVSAILCKSIMAVFRKHKLRKPTVVTQAVNMRRRANPQLPAGLIGNFPWLAVKLFDNENDTEIAVLAGQLREATSAINADFVNSLQGVNGVRNLDAAVKEMKSLGLESATGVDYIGLTSVCNMGGYEYDNMNFSWGKPIWATYCTDLPRHGGPLINTVFLSDTRVGKGIEALVILEQDEIAALEKDKELLSYASLDPCLLVSELSCLGMMH